MKKRLFALLLSIVMVVGLLPTVAMAGATNTWAAKLHVSENNAVKYNGQNTIELGFGVQSDNLALKTAQSMIIAIDLNLFDFIAKNGTVASESLSSSFLSMNYNKYAYSKYEDNDNDFTSWTPSVYFAYSGTTSFIMLQPSQDAADENAPEEVILMSVLIGLKSGKSVADITSSSIRLATKAEAASLAQSQVVMLTDGNLNTQEYGKTSGSDTLTMEPAISWDGITPAKPALTGTPTISGTAQVGQPLTASVTELNDKTNITYQWYANGNAINGATSAIYQLTASEAGKTITVKVTATNASAYSGTVTSAETAAVANASQAAPTLQNSDIIATTDTTITVTANAAWEYSKDNGGNWQTSNVFTSLTPNTTYGQICVRLAAKTGYDASPASNTVSGQTKKSQIGDEAKGTLAGYTGTYDGSAHDAVTGEAATGYTVQYSTTSANSGFSATMPKVTNVADSKTVWVKLSKDGYEDKVFPMTVTVNPKNISAVTINLGTQNTYSGSSQGVVITSVMDSTTALIKNTDYTITAGGSATNVETTTLTITGKGNYTGTKTIQWTLLQKSVNASMIASVADQPYTGSAITPKPAVTDGSALAENTNFTYSYENNINAGTATVKITGKGNYTGTASKTFQIIRADLAITVSITGWVVGGTPNAPSVSGNLGNGAVTYQYKVKDAGDNTYSSTVPTAEGNYTVKATVAQTANYNAASATADFAISTKAPQTVTAGNLTVKYGDTDKAVSASTNGDGTISYSVKSGSEYVEVNSSTGALTIKKVGTATITVTASETSAYAPATKDITVTVNPKEISAPSADTTVFTYNGQNQTYGITETANYTVSNGVQKNASTYQVTVALKDKTNTIWADSQNTTDKTFDFEIKKATITIAAKNKSAYVNETAPTLGESDYTVSGLVPNETLKTLPAIAYASTPDMTQTGTVTIKVSGAAAPDGGNYNDIVYTDGTLTISTKPSIGGGGGVTTYSITVDSAKNGTITVSPKSAAKGTTVTITVKPNTGYELDTLKVVDKNGDKVAVSEKNGKYTFTMPTSKVTVTGTFVEIEQSMVNPFIDVKESDYFYNAVMWAVKSGVTKGTSATTFSPNAPCTRAQMVTFLWRASGSPKPVTDVCPFTDVNMDSYYGKAVLWAVETGITNGTSETTFSPEADCTRAQMAAFLCRMAGGKAASSTISFTDVSADAYYAESVQWAVENGITLGTGDGTTFSPNEICTRAQMVTFLYRFFVK